MELTLAGAVESALRENLLIKEEGILVRRAEAEVTANQGEFDPSLKFDAGKSFSRESTFSTIASDEQEAVTYGVSIGGKVRTGTAYELRYSESSVERSQTLFLVTNPYYTSDLTLSVTQPLLRGMGRKAQEARLNSARSGFEAARLGAELRAVEVISDTAAAYWELYFSRSNLEVAGDSLKLAKNLLKEVKTKIRAGTLASVEIYKAEAEVALREERLLRAEKAVYDAEDALRALMNSEQWAPEIVPVDSPPEPRETPKEQALIEAALENRRDYRQALREYESREALTGYYRNQKLPGLDLTAGAGLSGLSGNRSHALDDVSTGDFYSWQVGVEFSIPLGNRAASGNYLKAKREEEGRAGQKGHCGGDKGSPQGHAPCRKIYKCHRSHQDSLLQ
jgi:outer membrane protein TolC